MKEAPQPRWLTKAIETRTYHINKKKEYPEWVIANTARNLKRSLGSICESLLIANWYRSHKDELEKFEYAKDALEFIREKKDKMNMEEVD